MFVGRGSLCLVSWLCLLSVGHAADGVGTAPPSGSAAWSWADLVREHRADRDSLAAACELPASAEYLDRLQGLERSWLARLERIDFDGLEPFGKVDYLAFVNELQQSLENVARQRKRLAELEPLISFRAALQTLEQARWQAAALDCRAAATQLTDLTAQVKQLHERVQQGLKEKAGDAKVKAGDKPAAGAPLHVTPAVALRAAKTVGELRGTLKSWFTFYDGYRPDFAWWIKKPYDEAGKQLEEYAKLLREEGAQSKGHEDDPLVGDPLGAEALAADIRCQWLPYTAAELIAIGQRELAWCEGQMQAAARDLQLGDDWHAALARVKADYVAPGQQDELVAGIAREATEFVKRQQLLVVPPLCEQSWRLTMISPDGVKTIPYAAYGGDRVMVAYANSEMKQEDKLMVMRGNNRHFMRLVVPHELIPGHHLQAFYAARSRPHPFDTPFFVEGWALYWELRLWDLGWARTPEDRIGMLFWRMSRCARVIVSLQYHLGRMTPPEMVTFLMERVGHERLGATSEVRRFISADPLYQASYLLGGLQLQALQKELVGGGRMTEEQFHDAVLQQPGTPIELLRAGLLRLPLTRSAKPEWRFAEAK